MFGSINNGSEIKGNEGKMNGPLFSFGNNNNTNNNFKFSSEDNKKETESKNVSEDSKEDLMEAKKQIWGVGENMGSMRKKNWI